jgi:O-antigen/teichoic acid export membrane protein
MTTPESADPLASIESEAERVQRNWTEILQELRVIQTGSQILTGFLLTLAFQPRFAQLDEYQHDLYLALVVAAAVVTVLGLTPVSLHRVLFRRNAKELIVRVANRVLKLTLAGVGITLTGTLVLIFDVVLGRAAGLVAGGVALVVLLAAWVAIPEFVRRRD